MPGVVGFDGPLCETLAFLAEDLRSFVSSVLILRLGVVVFDVDVDGFDADRGDFDEEVDFGLFDGVLPLFDLELDFASFLTLDETRGVTVFDVAFRVGVRLRERDRERDLPISKSLNYFKVNVFTSKHLV